MNRTLCSALEIPAGYAPLESAEPWERGTPTIGPSAGAPPRFILESWPEITFEGGEESLIKRVLPRRGVAVVYGKPASFKSFVVGHMALCVALGWVWAGRRVFQAPVVYIAAEGAAGLRKRKAGYVKAHPDLGESVPFSLVSSAPNLGADPGDLPELIAAIEAAGIVPGMIVIDTLFQTLGASDENGAGMTAFVANAGRLAQRFDCLVLIVHHVGLGDDKRMRGHSSLGGGVDATILCERQEGALEATLTIVKLKDEASDVRFLARMSRVVLGHDEDGDEISTLIVDSVEEAQAAPSAPATKSVPKSLRLLMDVVAQVLDEAGADIRAFGAAGPKVRAVAERHIRKLYFDRIAEKADPDEDAEKLYDRQRVSFKRAIKSAIDAKLLVANECGGERVIWLP
jgi:AAA domain